LNNECIYIDRCDNKSYSSSPTSRRCIKDYVSDYILCVSVSWLLPFLLPLKEVYQGPCIRLYLVCFSLMAPPPLGGVSRTMYQTISCVFQSHGSSPSRRSIKDYVSDYILCVSVSLLLPLKEEYQRLCIRLYLVCFSLMAPPLPPPPQGGVSRTMYQTMSLMSPG